MALQLPFVSLSFRADLREFIENMPATRLLGLQVEGFSATASILRLPIRPELTFDGVRVQGGIVATLADYAAVSAATAAMPAGWLSATTSLEVHNLEPAKGEHLLAVGKPIKVGKGLALAQADVFACSGAVNTLVATSLATCRLFERR